MAFGGEKFPVEMMENKSSDMNKNQKALGILAYKRALRGEPIGETVGEILENKRALKAYKAKYIKPTPLDDTPRPVTDVNWIPVAIPPLKEGRYLVWVRQNGSVLQGRMATFYWYPNSAVWEPTFKLGAGDWVDLWADVLPPFYTEGA